MRTSVILSSAMPHLLVLLLLHTSSALFVGNSSSSEVQDKLRNFVANDALADGERETRVFFNGVSAKQTWVKTVNGQSQGGLRLWQVTDGAHFIQLIYTIDGILQDCEYLKESHVVQGFLDSFNDDVERAKGQEELQEQLDQLDTKDFTEFRNVTFRVLGDDELLPEDLRRLVDYRSLRAECKQQHRSLKKLVHNKKHGNEEEKRRAEEQINRFKREVFILPGTLWCGKGASADSYDQFGPYAGADRCCREHDHCPFLIQGFSEKYNHFNYRMHTISHCDCDDRFRSCLKMTNTAASNLVGKLFFNIVQTKCFVLKPEKVCSKRSWWGKCVKYEYKKQAYIRDPIPY